MTAVRVPEATDVLDDEQASRQAAEANLAKELFEQMDRAMAQRRAFIPVPRDMTTGVLADALALLTRKHRHLVISVVRHDLNRPTRDSELWVEF